MGKGLKQELRLGEPSTKQPKGRSSEQAKEFRKVFKATLKRVNIHLQYTSAHAEEARHMTFTEKRDKAYAAYQATLKKIDPANPASAQGAIDQVTASIQGLEANTKALHEYAEEHYTAWTASKDQLDDAADEVGEMVEWGHSKGAALEQVVTGINEQAKLRKYREALETLNQFLKKLAPIHEDFVSQSDAKVAYEQMLTDKELTLKDFAGVDFVSLTEWKDEINKNLADIQQTAADLDYVAAFVDLEAELLAVDEFLEEASQLEEAKTEYETALAELQTRLDKTAGIQVLHISETVDRLVAEMKEAAESDDFAGALEKLNELSPEVDLKNKLVAKETYKMSAKVHEPTFTAANGTADEGFAPLVKAKDAYTAAIGAIEELVASEEWEDATTQLPAAATAAQEFIDLRAGFEKYHAAYQPIKADIDYVADLSGNVLPDPTWNEELNLHRSLFRHYSDGQFDQAIADLKALEPKISALKERVAASDAKAIPKATAAADEIRALAGGRNVATLSHTELMDLRNELIAISPKKQRQLLEDLHSPSTPLTQEQRAMQAALYNSMDLDEKFRKVDEKLRNRYEAALDADEELKSAITDWNAVDPRGNAIVDLQAKEEMLKRILATQSKAYGIDVPEIIWSDPSAPFVGEFDSNTGLMELNPHFANDPRKIIEAVLHENAHNFQDELAKKYIEGKISKRDPMYEQARTFALNYVGDAYVSVHESPSTYGNQPVESHAFDVGSSGVSRLIP